MKGMEIRIQLKCVREDELSYEETTLVEAAREAALRAYAPYSQFKVGAAALLENGEIITGNNQENIAFPSGMCAERVTLFYAQARYPFVPVKILAIAAFSHNAFTDRISPCGACRQVLAETEKRFGKPVRLLLSGRCETVIAEKASDLLPLAFGEAENGS